MPRSAPADHMRIPPAPRSIGSTITAAISCSRVGDQSLERGDDVWRDGIGQSRDLEQMARRTDR